MAVDRVLRFRSSFISAEELAALQPRTANVRGLPILDDDVYDTSAAGGLDDIQHEVLPVGDDEGVTQEQAPVETYLAWLGKLAVFARSPRPNVKEMLAAADELYIPRHTALQDIFDALGISAAGQEDPRIQDWMSMLLRNGDDLDLDTLSNVLEMLRTLADPERKRKASSSRKFEDRVLAEIEALKDQLSTALVELDRMQERTSNALSMVDGQIGALVQQLQAWDNYRTDLQGLSLGVQAAAETDGFDADDLEEIVTTMRTLHAPGEQPNFVSRAEWLAAVAGVVNTRELTLSEQVIATGQLAQQILDMNEAGDLIIDPKVREDIVIARDTGEVAANTAAEAEGETVVTADTATSETSV